jgi:hypothetical protein
MKPITTTTNTFVVEIAEMSSREIARTKQPETPLERIMKNLTLQSWLASLLSLILLKCAYGQITGVTAGTDLTGGGTSGSVTINPSIANTNLRLPVC